MAVAMGIFTLIIIACHAGLLFFAWRRSTQTGGGLRWLIIALVFSALTSATYLIPQDFTVTEQIGRGTLLILLVIATITAFGVLVIDDVCHGERRRRMQQIFLGASVAWGIGFIITALLTSTVNAGQQDWLVLVFDSPDASSLITLVGIVVAGLALIGIGLYEFYLALLPETANRALFWVLTTATLMLSLILVSSGTNVLAALGMVALTFTLGGAVYASTFHRVFDIRNGIIRSMRTLIFLGIAFAVIFATLYLVLSSTFSVDDAEGLLIAAAISLIVAAVLVPIKQGTDFVIQQLTFKQFINPAEATREYGQRVTETVELDSLVKEVVVSLNQVMRVRRSCLILLNSTFRVKNAVELLVRQPDGPLDNRKGYLSIYSSIYEAFAAQRKPLSQFDIEYGVDFRGLDDEERAFFHDLQMSAYAPIVLENALIGVLACGPMLNDTAFYPRDLQLLTTFAQQTGVALRNARLLDDMQHLNKSMQTLNQGLKVANNQLNKMDAVKTDFVTIASHELRTPLAQIRGYTDIIDAMNEQGMLDQTQTNSMVANLRKATERMEELIAAMLDVSQLDVNAMDLSLTDTPPETILRMAIEPLSDAISQRKLSLTARGLRGLPSIQADLQRLVQAFRNVIVNAIKFTPDGGRIEIQAKLQEAEDEKGIDQIIVEIRDTGVGINRKDLDLVFQKFYRAYDPSLHSTGTYKFLGAGPGLGLTIARGVIEGHGGAIWAESEGHDMEECPGTTFFIRLPVSTPEDARRVMTIDDENERDKPTHMKSPRVQDVIS